MEENVHLALVPLQLQSKHTRSASPSGHTRAALPHPAASTSACGPRQPPPPPRQASTRSSRWSPHQPTQSTNPTVFRESGEGLQSYPFLLQLSKANSGDFVLLPAGAPVPHASGGPCGPGCVESPRLFARQCRLGLSSSRCVFPGGDDETGAAPSLSVLLAFTPTPTRDL